MCSIFRKKKNLYKLDFQIASGFNKKKTNKTLCSIFRGSNYHTRFSSIKLEFKRNHYLQKIPEVELSKPKAKATQGKRRWQTRSKMEEEG